MSDTRDVLYVPYRLYKRCEDPLCSCSQNQPNEFASSQRCLIPILRLRLKSEVLPFFVLHHWFVPTFIDNLSEHIFAKANSAL